MFTLRSAVLLFAAAVSMRAATVFQTIDTFSRADAATLGSNWTQLAGNDQILNNQATAIDPNSVATYNGLASSNAAVDVFNSGSGLQYIALVLNYADATNNFYVKVQDNGSGAFDTYAFYYGDNGNNFATGGGIFQTLSSSFTSGQIWVTISGLTATLNIDPTFSGVAQQTYSFTYTADPGGTGTGMGFYGAAGAQDFGIIGAPEPGSFWLMGSVLAAAGIIRARRRG
jgi:hypothetical protein